MDRLQFRFWLLVVHPFNPFRTAPTFLELKYLDAVLKRTQLKQGLRGRGTLPHPILAACSARLEGKKENLHLRFWETHGGLCECVGWPYSLKAWGRGQGGLIRASDLLRE